MATINIKASTVMLTEKRAAEICSVLAEIGVEFIFTPSVNPNPQRNVLLSDLCVSVRAQRVMKIACETVGLNYDATTIADFVKFVSRNTLIKVRNCGKRALEEIQHILYEYGYSLA